MLSADQIADLLERPRPTDEQRAVIEAPLTPMLVIAGAGSGKTETMSARVVYLVANGLVAPDGVLGLTFTRKAAGELAERIRGRLRGLRRSGVLAGAGNESSLMGLDRPTVATYNSYAATLVGDHALRLGVEPQSRLLMEAGAWQLASEVVESWTDELPLDSAESTVVRAVLSLSAECAEHLVAPSALADYVQETLEHIESLPGTGRKPGPYADVLKVMGSLRDRAALVPLIERYRSVKRERDLLDFSDQVALAARVAQEIAEAGEGERERFPIVLLDEYQDTSFAQLAMLSGLFGGGHCVTAVGDPNQAIYGWRGASSGGLERFPQDFPPARVEQLGTSWRNDSSILVVANALAEPLRAASVAGSEAVSVPVLSARPGAGVGEVVTALTTTAEEEAAALAEFIRVRRFGPVGTDGIHARHAEAEPTARTCAVLCRRRSMFPVIEAALRAAGLPVEVIGLGGLLDTPEISDLVATLRVLHDPGRGDSLMRLLTGARLRIGASDLHALGDWARELSPRPSGEAADEAEDDVVDERSIIDALDALPEAAWRSSGGRAFTRDGHERLRRLAYLLRELRSRTYLAVPDLVTEVERALGLDIEVESRPGQAPGVGRRHLDAFRDAALSFVASSDRPTLGGFLAWLSAAYDHERGLELAQVEPDPSAVQVLTIHSAKGLEWDVVAVPGLVETVFPSHDTRSYPKTEVTSTGWLTSLHSLPYPLRGDRDALPVFDVRPCEDQEQVRDARLSFLSDEGVHRILEERRLAYVAVTRAQSSLYLSASWWGDGVKPRTPSRFLTELFDDPETVVAAALTAEGWADAPEEDTENPQAQVVVEAAWPRDPLGGERGEVQWAADLVAGFSASLVVEMEAAMSDDGEASVAAPRSRWERDARMLLAERAARRSAQQEVMLPAHLSASRLVRLADDVDTFALELRRPMPSEPSTASRRGTAFHAWVEQQFGKTALFEMDEIPGGGDDEIASDMDLVLLQEAFLASPWSQRRPRAVEVDIETPLAGVTLRCRIDAVFDAEAGQTYDVEVVDWKTGRPPRSEQARAAREVQLAIYRLAWSRRYGVPIERVSAAFVYVGAGETVRPADLLGERELEDLITNAVSR